MYPSPLHIYPWLTQALSTPTEYECELPWEAKKSPSYFYITAVLSFFSLSNLLWLFCDFTHTKQNLTVCVLAKVSP